MQSSTAQDYAATLRWAQVPLSAFVLSIVGFVYFYFGVRGGWRWLALATCVTRLVSLALNFTTGVNINFREVTGLVQSRVLGRRAGGGACRRAESVDRGSPSLECDAVGVGDRRGGHGVASWRSSAQRRAWVVGGSLVLCVGFAAAFAALVITGVVRAPTLVMPSVFIVVVAMGYELARDVIAAAHLSTQLRASEARFRAVVQSVPTAILLVTGRGLDRVRERAGAYGVRVYAGRARGQAGRRSRAVEGAWRACELIAATTCRSRRRAAWVPGASSSGAARTERRSRSRSGSIRRKRKTVPSCSSPSSTYRNAGASSRRRRASATKWRTSRGWACWARCRDRSRTSSISR